MIKQFITIIILCSIYDYTIAQKEDYNWVLTSGLNISFNQQPPFITDDFSNIYQMGNACISDSNGNLLFYTDGKIFFNNMHQKFYENVLIGQALRSIIIPVPNNPNYYYVISQTISTTYGKKIYQYIIYVQQNGMISCLQTTELFSSNQKTNIIVARHSDGFNYWLIVIDGFNGNVVSYLVSNTGIFRTITNFIGIINTNELFQPKMTLDMSKIVMVSNENLFFLNFDNTNGTVSNLKTITYNSFVSCCEFSATGKYLYVGLNLNSNKEFRILQHNVDSINNTLSFINSGILIYNEIFPYTLNYWLSDMQISPDNNIYVNPRNYQYLGIIQNPDDTIPICNFKKHGIYLLGKNSGYQFPTFISYRASISSILNCSNVFFRYQGINPQNIFWNFGDNQTSTELNPTHTYANAGTYTVNLIVTYTNGQQQTVSKQITINPKPINLIITHN